MLRNKDLYFNRLDTFYNGTGLNLKDSVYGATVAPVGLSVWSCPGLDRTPYASAIQNQFTPTQVGASFGPTWSTHWFKVEIRIPDSEEWNNQEVHLIFDTNSECMVWQNDQPMQGITGGTGGDRRVSFAFTTNAKRGEYFLLYLEMACNDRQMDGKAINPNLYFKLSTAEARIFRRDVWDLCYDYVVVRDMAKKVGDFDPPRAAQALYVANQIINMVKLEDPSTFAAARDVARQFLSVKNHEGQHTYHAIGHCHIDCAWLWPFEETRRKCARSWASTVRLMEMYPSSQFKFGCSSAQQFEWVKNDYPVLYDKIKRQVANGRFVPIGGTWVEMDCNMPNGESLVRQFLFGQKFFQEEFGVLCKEFWLPDTFGYAAQLPQICRSVGIKYFLTTKLSWNQVNPMPFSTFHWKALDGSTVLAHFPPGSIQADGSVGDILSAFNNKDMSYTNESLMLFGWGDGGGGPMAGHVEQLNRCADVAGVPKVKITSPREFFEQIEKTAKPGVGEWDGELYLEKHRATYTSQAAIKRYNRKIEQLFHDIDFVASLAKQYSDAYQIPRAELARLWKMFLLNQFHDILPGTAIVEAINRSKEWYEDITKSGTKIFNQALVSLLTAFGAASTPKPSMTRLGNEFLVFNTMGHGRLEVVEVPGLPVQFCAQVGANGVPLAVVDAPAYGWKVNQPQGTDLSTHRLGTSMGRTGSDGTIVLDNDVLTVSVTRHGTISSIKDKRADNREVIQSGYEANVLGLFDDNPPEYDAWDVEEWIYQKSFALSGPVTATLIETGPVRSVVLVEAIISGRSKLTQTITLTAGSPRVEFHTHVDWHEDHKFLKVLFPLNVRTTSATYEVAYGHAQRPTHANTSWDLAQFEVCAHRWADVSEYGYGVSLINDSKYGYSCRAGVMALSLLRAPKFPDPNTDMGEHYFSYALLPHVGSFQEAGVAMQAASFNNPLKVMAAPSWLPSAVTGGPVSFLSLENDSDGVVVDTVKPAESGDNAVIVRLYESHGGRHKFTLNLGPLRATRIVETDMLEREMTPFAADHPDGLVASTIIQQDATKVTGVIKPFQVVTLKVEFGTAASGLPRSGRAVVVPPNSTSAPWNMMQNMRI